MIELRNQTVENILNASDSTQVALIINESIKTLKNNDTHDFIIVRFLSKLEMSLKELARSPIDNHKIEYIREAIRWINNHELSKIKFDTK